MFAQRIELVSVCGFDLFTCYVGELGLGDEGLGFGADEFLLEDDDARGVGLFVLELGDLVGDFLFSLRGVSVEQKY